MRKVFAALVAGLMAAVAVQFFLAAMGAFDTTPKDESFQLHRVLGYGMLGYALGLALIGALIRAPGVLIGLTGLVAGLILLQGIIAAVAGAFGDTGGLVFGLHAINALAIIGVLEATVRRARNHATGPVPAA